MGITGFTLPTIYRWIHSDLGLSMSLHPFRKGHFLGSGQGYIVLAEAGLDGKSQYKAIKKYVEAIRRTVKAAPQVVAALGKSPRPTIKKVKPKAKAKAKGRKRG
jgi:hypothetical protein